jgi:hypothetical protein
MRAPNTGNWAAATRSGEMQRGFPHAVPCGEGGMVLQCGELCHGVGRAVDGDNHFQALHVAALGTGAAQEPPADCMIGPCHVTSAS